MRQPVGRVRELQSALDGSKERERDSLTDLHVYGNNGSKKQMMQILNKNSKEDIIRNNSSNGLRKVPFEVTKMLQKQTPGLSNQKSESRLDKRQVILQRSHSLKNSEIMERYHN